MFRFNKATYLSLFSFIIIGLTHSTMSMENDQSEDDHRATFNRARSFFEGISARHTQDATLPRFNQQPSQASYHHGPRNGGEARSRSNSQSSAIVPLLDHNLVSAIFKATNTRNVTLDDTRTTEAPQY